LHQIFSNFESIITLEDGSIIGGLGSAVLEFKNDHQYHSRIIRLGIPDRFIQQGKTEELYKECGFDVGGIVRTGREMIMSK